MDTIHKALYAVDHFQMTRKQQMWGDVYRCAFYRWKNSNYTSEGDYATMVAALGLGDRFWE